MNCKKGGFVSIRHDTIRDFEANLLKKVCAEVEIEPKLQPTMTRRVSLWEHVVSRDLDNRQVNTPIEKVYVKHENEKKRKKKRNITIGC